MKRRLCLCELQSLKDRSGLDLHPAIRPQYRRGAIFLLVQAVTRSSQEYEGCLNDGLGLISVR